MSKVNAERDHARQEIDERLDALENFSFTDAGTDEEIEILTNLICAFHLGRKTRARFATLDQVDGNILIVDECNRLIAALAAHATACCFIWQL